MALGAFFARLKQGLARSTQKLTDGISAIIHKRRLDDAALEELEELLISADLEEILALSDRIAVLFKGEITAEFEAGTADERELGLYMTGLQRRPAVVA